jgi:hypothetical protein
LIGSGDFLATASDRNLSEECIFDKDAFSSSKFGHFLKFFSTLSITALHCNSEVAYFSAKAEFWVVKLSANSPNE